MRLEVRTESTSGSYFGGSYTGGFGLHGGAIDTETASVSVLAQLLAPPFRPEPNEPQAGFALMFTAFGLLALVTGFGGEYGNLVLGLIVFPLGIVGFFWEHQAKVRARQGHEAALASYKRQMHIWERLNYCRRCDQVFDPHTEAHAPSNAWRPLLGK